MKPRKDSADRGAGSGCMARLVRFFDSCDVVPRHSEDFVGSVSIGRSIKDVRMFIEFLPHDLIDVVSKPVNHVSHIRRSLYDSLGYKSLHNAVSDAEIVGLRLLSVVKPKNLLFFFGEPSKVTFEFFDGLLVPSPTPECSPTSGNHRHDKKSAGDDQSETEPRAVVLCKLNETDLLKELLRRKQQHGGHKAECYQVTWRELQDLKRALQNSVNHVGISSNFLANVKEHAPPLAGASVETGGEG